MTMDQNLSLVKKAVEEMEASGLTTKNIYRPPDFPFHHYEKQTEFENEADTIVVEFIKTGRNKKGLAKPHHFVCAKNFTCWSLSCTLAKCEVIEMRELLSSSWSCSNCMM